MTYEVGNAVRWTSQSHGSERTKTGIVVEVVAADANPATPLHLPGFPRKHTSYVVEVRSKPGAKPKYYWPRVANLSLVADRAVNTVGGVIDKLKIQNPATGICVLARLSSSQAVVCDITHFIFSDEGVVVACKPVQESDKNKK